MLHFMQIYGNCAAVHCLGPDRIRGPVDNVITKGTECLTSLLQGTYYEKVISTTPEIFDRPPGFEGDSVFAYNYGFVRIVHENPLTTKYAEALKTRCENLNNFLPLVKTNPNYYLIYSLNIWEVDNKSHKLREKRTEDNIKILKDFGILDKVIFIGSLSDNKNSLWNFSSDDMIKLIKKYNLKYIEINNIGHGPKADKSTISQFNKKVIDAINNGTNKKYLVPRFTKKPTDTKKEERKYYLYF